jgi:predicted O-linked N-acetylglucosamine transferase (SPINDLY family)
MPRVCPLGVPVASIMTTAPTSSAASAAVRRPTSLIDEVKRVLDLHTENPGDNTIWQEVVSLRRTVAAAIAALPIGTKTGLEVEAADQLLNLFYKSGASDYSPAAEDLELGLSYAKKNWPGLLAAMLLIPSWEWPGAPKYDDVPSWMWPAFTVYAFHTPQAFSAVGQAEKYAAHYLRRLEELARAAGIARGSAAVKASIDVYVEHSDFTPLYLSRGALRSHLELRAKIIAIALNIPRQEEMLPLPRDGRRLRIGFVSDSFDRPETRALLPMFEHLDTDRFETVLFSLHQTNSVLEAHCRQRTSEFRLLPADMDSQVQSVRSAFIDVLVFGDNLTAGASDICRLALHRLAPLQVVASASSTTSGMPEIDLYLSGSENAAINIENQFTERLGLIPGPAHAFQYDIDRTEPTTAWTRDMLGLPQDAVVFVTAANFFRIGPEVQHAWARLLASVPGSRLLVHPFNPNVSAQYPVKRFCASFDRVFAEHGVATDRLLVSADNFSSRSDVKELLSVGDIYLDAFPVTGASSLVDPLELGLPVISLEGETIRSHTGGSLLRSLGLAELIAPNENSYHERAVALAKDSPRRVALKERIADAMTRVPVILDTFAHSEAVGHLLERSFDELVLSGGAGFRKARQPIKCGVDDAQAVLATGLSLLEAGLHDEALQQARSLLATQPASIEARHFMGLTLAAKGQTERAKEYLVAAVQSGHAPARVWYDLAGILKRSGDYQGAITSIETALRIDQSYLDAWFLLGEMARDQGHLDMMGEVGEVVAALAPNDPRTSRLAR